MKILYYTQTNFLDCDLPLIKALTEMGNDVFLVFELLPYQLKSTIIDIKRQQPNVEILPLTAYDEFHLFPKFVDSEKCYILNRPCKVYSWKNVKLRIAFSKLVEKIAPDIIHCTNFIDLPDLFLYRYRRKIVQIVHDPFLHLGENSFRTNIKRMISYKMIKCFVLLNKNQKEQFINKNRLDEEHVYINRLGTYDYLNLYKQDSCESKGKLILFWGRISPYKGVEYLLEAMEIIHQQLPEAKLIIAGSGKLYFDYSPYKNKNYIKLINRYITMNELGHLLSSATVVVCPYTDATQSGVVMSAYTYQIPVVATKVGGLPEMIEDHVTGLLVSPNDSKALAMGIIDLLKSDDIINQYKKNIYEYCHNGIFSWENIALKYIKIYYNLLFGENNNKIYD